MRIKTVKVTRKYNLGNYQTIDLTLEAEVAKGEDGVAVLKDLEKKIHDYYMGRGPDLATAGLGVVLSLRKK